MRPTWDDFYLGIALAASRRGDCRRSRVGAVIVQMNRRGHMTSLGYNGVEPGEPGCLEGACPRGLLSYDEMPPGSNYQDPKAPCVSTHAEENSWLNAQFDVEGATCYVTRQPCGDCKQLLFAEGIRGFVYPGGTIVGGHLNPQ